MRCSLQAFFFCKGQNNLAPIGKAALSAKGRRGGCVSNGGPWGRNLGKRGEQSNMDSVGDEGWTWKLQLAPEKEVYGEFPNQVRDDRLRSGRFCPSSQDLKFVIVCPNKISGTIQCRF